MIGLFLCSLGFHRWKDTNRSNAVTGWTIVQRDCTRCGARDLDIG